MRYSLRCVTFFCALAGTIGLAACGGGGGSSPAGSGSLPSTGGGGITPQGSAPAQLALTMQQYTPVNTSSTHRRAAFVSPATAQISLTVVSVNGQTVSGTPMTFPVSPGAQGCAGTNGVVTCNLTANIPIGNDVLAASTLDANGHSLGSSTITATVLQNATNRIALAVGGEIANIEMFLAQTHFTTGTAGSVNVFVIPLDDSGAQIVNPGNYNPAIAITSSSSGGGHLSLITDGTNTGLSGTLNSPNDQIVVAYDGGGTTGSTNITANAGSGITATQSVSFSPPSVLGFSANPGGAQFVSSNSYIFTAPGQTGTIAVSGGTPPYAITSSDTGLATVSPTSGPGPFTVTAAGFGTNGSATITVHDSATGTTTIPVTFIAPPVILGIGSCGGSLCTGGSASYTIPLGGPTGPLTLTTVNASGGTGAYTYFFISTGLTTSPYASVSQTGGQFQITPNGFGNDAIIIESGNAYAYFAINASADQFGQTLPHAIGMIMTQGTGKFYAATLPNTASNAVPSPLISGFMFNAGSPPSIDATPTSSGTGAFTFTNTSGGTSQVPYTVFGVSFGTYAGGGASNSTSAAVPADEALVGAGVVDTVTVSGYSGTLSAVSGNTNVISTVVSGGTVTVTAVAAGTTIVTLSDSSGASASYTVSVTTTSIPISSTTRRQ